MENFSGTLRITNKDTLEKWKSNGKYDSLIKEGYIYNPGCGRFSKEIKCNCSKCRKYEHTRPQFSNQTN